MCSFILPITSYFLKTNLKCLPCELWLSRSDARVKRVLLRLRVLSEASACSRSAEKSESSVPSELLPAVLWRRNHKSTAQSALFHHKVKWCSVSAPVRDNMWDELDLNTCVLLFLLPADNSTKIPCWGRSINLSTPPPDPAPPLDLSINTKN